jgi:hypothetical protein
MKRKGLIKALEDLLKRVKEKPEKGLELVITTASGDRFSTSLLYLDETEEHFDIEVFLKDGFTISPTKNRRA